MAQATVTWVKGKEFVGTDSGRHSVVLSADGPAASAGCKPSEMLLVALAACSSVDVVEILAKKRLKLLGLEVGATGEQDPEPPWAYRRIHLHYRLRGSGLTPAAVEQAIRLSEEKYCSVAATIRGVAAITWDYQVDADDAPAGAA